MLNQISKNLLRVQEEIEPYKPNIIAVTKYFGKEAILEAYKAGLRNFGENRVLDAIEKIQELPEEIQKKSTFHLIGHLQTNKAAKAVKVFDVIHSIDSLKLAETISQEALKIGKRQKILLQVNNAGEIQKSGFSKEELFENFEEIQKLKGVAVIGLMNMAPKNASHDELMRLFAEIKEIKNLLNQKFNCNLKEISMGMSGDYKEAVLNGATMIRLGTKLFGTHR